MTYQLTTAGAIIRTADNAFIPADKLNGDYVAYLEWLEAGNTPERYVAPSASSVLTPEEKLAASGLTIDELKQLLGLE